jgi:O-antigen ligase
MAGLAGCSMFVLFYFRKPVILLYLLVIGVAGVILWQRNKDVFFEFHEEWILKGRKAQEGILYSRIRPWETSWEKAKERLWSGYGFGVTEETSEGWEAGYSSSLARLKGSTYLSVLEELGVPGLAFSLLFSLCLLSPGRVIRLKKTMDRRQFAALLACYAIACAGIANVAFEEWLFSVGNAFTIMFWHVAYVLSLEKSRRLEPSGKQL